MRSQLQQERHLREQEIGDREKAIMERCIMLGVHKDKLERNYTFITLQRELETLSVTITALQQELNTSEPGHHLLDVKEKLYYQANAMAESIKKMSQQSQTFLNNPDLHESQGKVIQSKMGELEDQFKSLLSISKKRHVVLEDSLSFYQLIQVRKNISIILLKIIFYASCRTLRKKDSGVTRSLPSALPPLQPRT